VPEAREVCRHRGEQGWSRRREQAEARDTSWAQHYFERMAS